MRFIKLTILSGEYCFDLPHKKLVPKDKRIHFEKAYYPTGKIRACTNYCKIL